MPVASRGLVNNLTVHSRVRPGCVAVLGARIDRECTLADVPGEENGEPVLFDLRSRLVTGGVDEPE